MQGFHNTMKAGSAGAAGVTELFSQYSVIWSPCVAALLAFIFILSQSEICWCPRHYRSNT
jgi:hypothetical protein